jgi:glycosyltransferase involved in cell wall biosynthesis
MKYIHQMLVSQELGGAGLIGIHLANFMREKEHASCVWIPGEGVALRKVQQFALPCNVYDASCVFRASKMRTVIGNWKIWHTFRPYRPGIVHIHSPYHYKALQWGFKMLGLKTVVHIHLQEAADGLRWAFETPPDVIVTCARSLADHVRQTLPERYQAQQQILAVPNAVDVDRFYPDDKSAAKQRVGAPQDLPLVLMIANLAPHKGQETAIRTIAILKKAGVNVACWLVGVERRGGGDYTMRLQTLCNELAVADRVRFLGQRDDVPGLMRAADIFVLPSMSEGLPLSVLEAQATKVPVLAAPTAGIPDVVRDGKTGFLIPADDANGYAQRIASLLKNPEAAHRVAEHAYRQVLKEHNWQTYCETMWLLYQSLWDESVYGNICTAHDGTH